MNKNEHATNIFTKDINSSDYSLSIFTDDFYLKAIDYLKSTIDIIDRNRWCIKDADRFNAIYSKAVEAKDILENITIK